MKLATFNVNSLRARMGPLEHFVATVKPDVIALQETKLTDALFPADALRSLGYPHLAWTGQPTYNGVALLSRLPLEDVTTTMGDGLDDDQRRFIAARVADVTVVNVYVPNGQAVGTDKFRYKLGWLDRLIANMSRRDLTGSAVALMGDFNIAPGDSDVWDPFVWDGQILTHPEERRRFQALLALGLTDAWRHQHPYETSFSWWDYQRMGWPRNQGLRIDHVLLSAPAMARCRGTVIHKEIRGGPTPSDHAPVVVELSG